MPSKVSDVVCVAVEFIMSRGPVYVLKSGKEHASSWISVIDAIVLGSFAHGMMHYARGQCTYGGTNGLG